METETTEATGCTWCGNKLLSCPDDPSTDDQGDPICEACWHDHYTFRCCWCERYGMVKNQHNMVVVAERERGVPKAVMPGIYLVLDTPYYADGIVEGHLYSNALERLSDVPEGVLTGMYRCGHLCMDCQEKID